MHIFGEEIRLDPEKDRVAVEEDDWAINRPECLMDHLPSGVAFVIDVDETAKKAGEASLFDFCARPVHICNGRQLPGREEMTELGRAAILLYLEAIGCISARRTETDRKDASPDLSVN